MLEAKQPSPPSLTTIQEEYERTLASGANYLFYHDAAYPPYLKEIEDAPPFLIYHGNLELLKQKQIAMVGSRNASLTGKKMAFELAKTASQMGWGVISGLARGIDTAAHQAAIENGTIAVIAGGIDNIYPAENNALYALIKEKGLLLTEAPIGVPPQARHFPKRNRIISALSSILLVVEATLRSGSLITAHYAIEHNKEIWAIPGSPMDPRAAGTNQLIKNGATMIADIEDFKNQLSIFNENTITRPQSKAQYTQMSFSLKEEKAETLDKDPTLINSSRSTPNEARNKIQKTLGFIPISLDELIRECQISSQDAQMILLEFELAGKLERHPGNKISLKAS